jgi:membrane associated rhomboid family serine protease
VEEELLLDLEVILEASASLRRIRQLHVVLSAASIDSRIGRRHKNWTLITSQHDAVLARAEIDAYLSEQVTEIRIKSGAQISTRSAYIGVMAYLAIVSITMYLQETSRMNDALRRAGEMQSSGVHLGQWWRCFTALTLHHDAAHVVGNLAMGGLFGWMVSKRLGAGLAWLVILIAGGLGNGLSGIIRDPGHVSIGASTAVFAALGLLTADSTFGRSQTHESNRRRWLPMISGVVLFSWTGLGGPNTDVLSHLMGFCSGIAIGAIMSLNDSMGTRLIKQHQGWSAIIAIIFLATSWLVGFASLT